jgi:cytochrome b subunit of formate dehydrogenase/nitrate/TMAO reductase-like tetraheme cytochrome c subunit
MISVLIIAPVAVTSAKEASGECRECHSSPEGKAPAVSLPPDAAHGKLKCGECHVGQDMPPCPPKLPSVKCDTCHQDQVRALGKSSHGKNLLEYFKEREEKVKLADICLSCHGSDIHQMRSKNDRASPSFRENVINTCLSCHKESGAYMLDEYEESIHSSIAENDGSRAAVCTDCHGDHGIDRSSLSASTLSRQATHETCGKCHDSELSEYASGIHFETLVDGDTDVPTCTDCHGTHNIYGPNDVRSLINHLQVDGTCIGCHANQEITRRHDRLPTPEFVKSYEGSVHGRGVHTKGLMVSATCVDCHGHHGMRPKTDEESSVYRRNIPNTCKECHLGIFADFEQSAHGELWKRGDEEGPVCTTCHTAHEIQEPTRQLFTIFRIDKECAGCHEERSKTYSDTFHGKTTSMGFLVAAKCSDCHTPHYNLPAEDPDSSIHLARLTDTCGRCHGEVNENFVKYNPHPDPGDKERFALLYWINKFMKLLIAGVFGFFGVHTLLWFQRSLVAYVRKEGRTSFPLEGVKHVRRWSKSAVILHIVIVTSFLGLVATGLPLRYHYTEWARWLGSIYGGVEVARYFHRFCAAVTIGYAVYHILFIAYKILINRQFRMLYGPDTMVPRFKDVVDMYHNFRYFLYLGPPPRFCKWTYWEKFDYFALFWGVPIVVVSGLVMLFPTFFSVFLPGSWLNVASLVHSEEALLAAGFIFVFHFFHNHLRPGIIPMDINIFMGTMPLERLIHEHPEEYERLDKEGLLSEYVIDAPEKRVMWESRLFGFLALMTGLFLIVAIFVSYILG